MSDDGRFAVVVIALFGNPFSSAYARARAGAARALDHCALHVALYGPGAARWSLRERPVADADRSPTALVLGRSRVVWEGDRLKVDVDETTTPGGRAIRGRITVVPEVESRRSFRLDAAGEHAWWPVAPLARVDVALSDPALRFDGGGYHDANAGTTALDATFARWSWTRARLGTRAAIVSYDVVERRGAERPLGLLFSARGERQVEGLRRARLPATRWGLPRSAPVDADSRPRILRSLDDGPCYARALVATRVLGHDVSAVHEVLSGDRLSQRWVRFLLGFRMGTAP